MKYKFESQRICFQGVCPDNVSMKSIHNANLDNSRFNPKHYSCKPSPTTKPKSSQSSKHENQ